MDTLYLSFPLYKQEQALDTDVRRKVREQDLNLLLLRYQWNSCPVNAQLKSGQVCLQVIYVYTRI